MLNVVTLAGRIKEILPKEKDENDTRKMILSVQRNYQNADGDYDCDLFEVIIWRGLAKEIQQRCKTGDCITLRGRLEIRNDHYVIIAEQACLLPEAK